MIDFVEFTSDTRGDNPRVTFRLIHESGEIKEVHVVLLSMLSKM